MELLSPAGDRERLEMAIFYGADAVYLAGRQFGMRSSVVNFSDADLRWAVQYAHARDVKIYVTCNTLPREEELRVLPGYLEFLQDAGVDALIIADLGVLELAKRHAPKVARHVSTQFGVINSATANALHALGADTVVLARETPLEDIRKIRDNTPEELHIEAFVHGAMCVSFSGRCLLSNYLTGRDANRGQCAQPCRWKYHLVEETRPGQYFEISEDGGTFIMNSRDMRMIEHLPELLDAGVTSLKIEGRMKSATIRQSLPTPIATLWTRPWPESPWTRSGWQRRTRSATDLIPPVFTLTSPARATIRSPIPLTRLWPLWWRTAGKTPGPPLLCATRSPRETRWNCCFPRGHRSRLRQGSFLMRTVCR